jgi:hypothetical protein
VACRRAGKLVDALVELHVSEGSCGLKVVDGELLGPAMGVMGDPVVIRSNSSQLTALV